MRCLSLRRDVNSNANDADKREALREGKPSAEQVQGNALPLGEWVQGNALAAVNCCTPFRSCDN